MIHPRAEAKAAEAFGLRPLPALPLDHGPNSYRATLEFLDAQAPDLARLVRETEIPERARPNVVRFFASLLASSERFRLAREQPQLVRRAVEVIGASEYLAELLIHHPEDLAIWQPHEGAGGVRLAAPSGVGIEDRSGYPYADQASAQIASQCRQNRCRRRAASALAKSASSAMSCAPRNLRRN